MKQTLLIGEEFWRDLYGGLRKAKKEILVQFMTFEGDKTGLELEEALKKAAKRGVTVRVLIDCFTDHFVSDTYYTKPEVKEEVEETAKMIERMEKADVEVKRTRPYGIIKQYFLARNHKKIVVIDDALYLGGINVSDHNRAWHDFMVKIEDKKILTAAVKDFERTWKGEETSVREGNFVTNNELEKMYYDTIAGAKKEIIISSPYIVDRTIIHTLREKNVKKNIYTLAHNNIGIINKMSNYVFSKLMEDGAEIYHYNEFSHAKFTLVDREKLLIGSSNFGRESFDTNQEVGYLITDKKFIEDFVKRMVEKKKFTKYTSRRYTMGEALMTYFLDILLSMYAYIAKGVKPLA